VTARVGIITFPGSLDEAEAARAVRRAGGEPVPLWHDERDLRGADAVVLPGGFSYGDYLRCGAIARFAPVMAELTAAVPAGLPVLGICNGFQILCEAHLLPGALTRNAGLHFVSRDVRLRVENVRTPWTRAYAAGQEVRYLGNPNGSARDIAGVSNEAGNVAGLMPHPEYATSELTGPGCDGLGFFASAVSALVGA